MLRASDEDGADGTGRAADGPVPAKRPGLLATPTIWWPLVCGVLLILLSIACEHGLWVRIVDRVPAAGTVPAIIRHSDIFNTDVPILLVAEVGYALLIAWVVSIAIEAGSRKEHNRAVEESRQAISKDVFQGVYAIRHNSNYVRTVISTCLEETMMRENYSISYKIDPLPASISDKIKADTSRFVLVTVTARYDLRNVGPDDNTYTSTYGIPVQEGVLEEHAKVTLIKTGNDAYEGDNLAKIAKRGENDEIDYEFKVKLEARESKEVLIEAVLIKELSDSDTFGFRRPTMGATIRLDVNVQGVKCGATERTASPMKAIRAPAPGRTAEWKIDGPILPFNSVVLWWRPDKTNALNGREIEFSEPPAESKPT